ncbi:MAG TPA: VOC family protein [Rhodanobacteraceae bacterium]|jgi:lactoylglutathione lyase|nr:VOC family protein [Rhodanobacteraceae bacterium]
MSLTMLANIDVDDIARAETFYVEALGLEVGRRFGDSGVELIGASSPIYLLRKAAGSVAGDATMQMRDYRRHWTPVHLDFVVDDLAGALARARAAGATLEGEPRTATWGRIATLADPFGHGFCLIEFRNRGYDEIAT